MDFLEYFFHNNSRDEPFSFSSFTVLHFSERAVRDNFEVRLVNPLCAWKMFLLQSVAKLGSSDKRRNYPKISEYTESCVYQIWFLNLKKRNDKKCLRICLLCRETKNDSSGVNCCLTCSRTGFFYQGTGVNLLFIIHTCRFTLHVIYIFFLHIYINNLQQCIVYFSG